MKRVALSSLWYPVSISRFFESALENRDDIELVSVGPFTGTFIPWGGGIDLPEKYAKEPTVPLSRNLWNIQHMSPAFLKDNKELQDIDVWIQADSTFYFNERPPCRTNVHIAIDPHVLDYSKQRTMADYFFNMQKFYSQPGDLWLPYCASKYHHYREDVEPEYDVCLIGLQYQHRNELVSALRAQGISVQYGLGMGFDEYRMAYSKSRVAISWSSLDDLIARVFEAGAFGLPLVTNRVPDMPELFTEGMDYLGFASVGEAVAQVKKLLDNPEETSVMANNFHKSVMGNHLYDHRINQIFETVGL